MNFYRFLLVVSFAATSLEGDSCSNGSAAFATLFFLYHQVRLRFRYCNDELISGTEVKTGGGLSYVVIHVYVGFITRF